MDLNDNKTRPVSHRWPAQPSHARDTLRLMKSGLRLRWDCRCSELSEPVGTPSRSYKEPPFEQCDPLLRCLRKLWSKTSIPIRVEVPFASYICDKTCSIDVKEIWSRGAGDLHSNSANEIPKFGWNKKIIYNKVLKIMEPYGIILFPFLFASPNKGIKLDNNH
jgi:hypothetical protein